MRTDWKPEPREKKKRVPLKRTQLKRKYNPTGELRVFREMWNNQKHVCQDCGTFLTEFSHSLFHHIKSKGKFPELRLVKANIKIICFDCHFKIHNG